MQDVVCDRIGGGGRMKMLTCGIWVGGVLDPAGREGRGDGGMGMRDLDDGDDGMDRRGKGRQARGRRGVWGKWRAVSGFHQSEVLCWLYEASHHPSISHLFQVI